MDVQIATAAIRSPDAYTNANAISISRPKKESIALFTLISN